MTEYEQLVQRGRERHGERFEESDLAPEFRPYFRTGQRVRVRYSYGEEVTGTIGASTGWRPCFLLMRTARSVGSSYVLGTRDHVVAVQKAGRYIPVEEVRS